MSYLLLLILMVGAALIQSVFPSLLLSYAGLFLLSRRLSAHALFWAVAGGFILDLFAGWSLGGSSIAGLSFLCLSTIITHHLQYSRFALLLQSAGIVLIAWVQRLIISGGWMSSELLPTIVWLFVFFASSLIVQRLMPQREEPLRLQWRTHGQ